MATKPTLSTPSTTLTSTVLDVVTSSNLTWNNTTYQFVSKNAWNKTDFWNAAFLAVEILSSLLSVLILGLNLVLFVVIVSSPSLRGRLRNQLLLSLVVVFLMLGIFDTAFSADFASRRRWRHGCYFNVIRSLMARHVQNFVSMWGTVVLLLHYLVRVQRYQLPEWVQLRLPVLLQRAVGPLVVAAPWLGAVLVMTPLVFGGLHRHVYIIWTDSSCPLFLEPWARLVLNILSYILPALGLIALNIAILVLYRRRGSNRAAERSNSGGEMGTELVDDDNDDLESPWVYVVTGALVFLFQSPEHLFYTVRLFPVQLIHWKAQVIAGVTMELFSELMPVTLALVWLFMFHDVKERLLQMLMLLPCCKMLCPARTPPKSSGESSVHPVAFRDLHDE